jgi:hypothetical protein
MRIHTRAVNAFRWTDFVSLVPLLLLINVIRHRHIHQPCLQLVISYTRVEVDARTGLFVSSPRLRLFSMLPPVCKSSLDLLKRTDSEVVLCVLVQKVSSRVRERS